jgi:hypothetical protein
MIGAMILSYCWIQNAPLALRGAKPEAPLRLLFGQDTHAAASMRPNKPRKNVAAWKRRRR